MTHIETSCLRANLYMTLLKKSLYIEFLKHSRVFKLLLTFQFGLVQNDLGEICYT